MSCIRLRESCMFSNVAPDSTSVTSHYGWVTKDSSLPLIQYLSPVNATVSSSNQQKRSCRLRSKLVRDLHSRTSFRCVLMALYLMTVVMHHRLMTKITLQERFSFSSLFLACPRGVQIHAQFEPWCLCYIVYRLIS